MEQAPISQKERKQLLIDAHNIRAAAIRKNVTLNEWEEDSERRTAENYFELGCWLYYFFSRLGKTGVEGLTHRVECARLLFMAGITNPGYRFFTIFNFGERQFDTIFEMGDAMQVIAELRKFIPTDKTGKMKLAFEHYGWPVEAHGIVSILSNKNIMFKVVAGSNGENALKLATWVKAHPWPLTIEDVYNAAKLHQFGSKEDLVVQDVAGSLCYDIDHTAEDFSALYNNYDEFKLPHYNPRSLKGFADYVELVEV